MENGTTTPPDFTQERDKRCVPLARRVLEIVGSYAHEIPLGQRVDEEERMRVLSKIYTDIIELLKEANIKIDDIGFVFSLAQQGLSLTSDIVQKSMQKNQQIATRILWKIERNDQLTIMDLDAVIKGQELPNRMGANDPAVFNNPGTDAYKKGDSTDNEPEGVEETE